MRLTLRNDGFAAPYNPRPVALVLRDAATGTTTELPTGTDARGWAPGPAREVDLAAAVPATLPAGTYELLLSLADPAPALHGRPEYAIRLADEGLWDAASGLNDLGTVVAVR